MNRPRFIEHYRLMIFLGLLLAGCFFATSVMGYFVAKDLVRSNFIDQDLSLTASNISAEIQKDVVRAVLISSTMAHDTFVRDWVLKGERQPQAMTRYLAEIKESYGAFSSFFVSERSGKYYTGNGVLKKISRKEPRDAWYYHLRETQQAYEVNIDLDMANRDAMTLFINHRVDDFKHRAIGAIGVGLTIKAVRRLVDDYQARFQRTIYFADQSGHVVLAGSPGQGGDLRQRPGLGPLVEGILGGRTGFYQFEDAGHTHLVNVSYLPELKWYLFVEQDEDAALSGIRHTLYASFAISLAVTLTVVFLAGLALRRYQSRIEEMASTDKLTGLFNRHACAMLLNKVIAAHERQAQPVAFLMADIDHFKRVNDRHGHRIGDMVLAGIADLLRARLRAADFAVRWGGEEFLLVLPGCNVAEGALVGDELRQVVAAASFGKPGAPFSVTISIGVSELTPQESPEAAISRADEALYAAKRAGRNRVCVAPKPAAASGPSVAGEQIADGGAGRFGEAEVAIDGWRRNAPA
ncbi:MAG: sensor domain-containing diguanylate cyclase [Azonexus sp.]|jgi:diguanylate cyclase (GGDEF)-like protein|nr:sensor domain-containing diguanylate cyclase [Azonexus sp.]